MGTNYFAIVNLGGPEIKLHIGKSSIGWCFGLAVHDGIESLDDWRCVFAQAPVRIIDEYGARFSAETMIGIITIRDFYGRTDRPASWWADNHAIPGPFGLARHAPDDRSSLPPDPERDTYDLIRGYFS